MITTELEKLVSDEVEKLRIHATEEERNRLDFDSLDSNHTGLCIYGQMTGNCYSKRSHDLLKLCATPYSWSVLELVPLQNKSLWEDELNARFARGLFSAIEFYICQKGADNKGLIERLRS